MLIPFVSILWLHALGPLLVDAHATRDNVGCGFHLSCSGAFNGSIGEKSSGQVHAGGDGMVAAPSLFTWFGDAFADQSGSGCWWTPPTFTLQCDRNQPPDHGFQIGCDGTVSFNGQSVFYECPTGEGDEVNLYLRPVGDQCHEVSIHADNCAPSTCPAGGVSPPGGGGGSGPVPGGPGNSPSSSPPSSGATPATPAMTPSSPNPNSQSGGTPSSPVPTTLLSSSTTGPPSPTPFTTGGDQTTKTSITSTSTITTTVPPSSSSGSGSGSSTSTSSAPATSTTSGCAETGPERIILTDLGNPDAAYGPNDGGHIQVSPNASSIFNFRFDDADVGKTCQFFFRLTSAGNGAGNGAANGGNGVAFNLTGTGIVAFEALEGWADANTTYNSMPRTVQVMDDTLLFAGIDRPFPAFPCPGSSARSAVLLSEGPWADTCLDTVQSPGVGMFLRKC